MSLYVNGVLQAGINNIPSYTRAEYEALTEKPEYWICTDEDYEDMSVVFTEASERTNIQSGETLPTLFGKIKKWFTDLVSMFVSKSGDTMRGILYIDRNNGTASSLGGSPLYIGNNTPSGTVGNSRGVIYLYGKGQYWGRFFDENGLTADRSYYLPDKSGIFAVTDKAQLSSGIYLYRVGNIRVLHINGATCSNVVATTIPSGDRPSNNKVFVISWFGYIGRMAIGSNGTIGVGHYQNYGVNTVSDDSTSTVTVNACIAWGVD